MELYGQAHPVVYGDSIIRCGNISGLSGTLRPDALCTLDLIQKGYFGLWWGGFDTPKELIYLKPGTRHFKTAGSNLAVNAFTREPNRTVLTAPVAPRVSGSGEGPDERLHAFPVTTKDLQMIDRNNSVWISSWDKPVVMRLPKDNLRDIPNKASQICL
jgi:hypothetical protein